MKFEIGKYPNGKNCALALTLDDLHPEGVGDLEGLDFGFDFHGAFWNRMHELRSSVPELKATLFAVADWRDRSDFPSGIFWPLRKVYKKRRKYPSGKFSFDSPLYSSWIEELNVRIEAGWIEVAMHGLEHHSDNLQYGPSQEFRELSEGAIRKKLREMKGIFEVSGAKCERGFRSPGWGLSEDLSQVLSEEGFLYVANGSDFFSSVSADIATGAGEMGQSLKNASITDGVVGFIANTYPDQIGRAVEIAEDGGIVMVHAHIARTIFGLRFVDRKFVRKMTGIAREIRNRTAGHIWFATLGEMARFFLAKEETIVEECKEGIRFRNGSDFDLLGLTVRMNGREYIVDRIPARSEYVLDSSVFSDESALVSVVLTVYNGQATVISSLDSLSRQSYRNMEILVIDDGSTDATAKLLKGYVENSGDTRIRIIRQENAGRARAKNVGLREASGSVIVFCEDDAKYDREYVQNAVQKLSEEGDGSAGVIGPHFVWNRDASVTTRVKDIERRRNFISYVPKSCWFYRKNLLDSLGGFNEDLEFGEDVEPAIRLARMGFRFSYEEKCLWLHREPEKFFGYLKRKFKGGMGMALLERLGLKKRIVPISYLFAATAISVLFFRFVFLNPEAAFFFLLTALILLLLVRIRDVIKMIGKTDESFLFLCFGIYIEYIWWAATLSGYLRGKILKKADINDYLRGR